MLKAFYYGSYASLMSSTSPSIFSLAFVFKPLRDLSASSSSDRFCAASLSLVRLSRSSHILGTLTFTNMGYTSLSIYTLRSFVVISSVSFGRSSSFVLDPMSDRTLKSSVKSEYDEIAMYRSSGLSGFVVVSGGLMSSIVSYRGLSNYQLAVTFFGSRSLQSLKTGRQTESAIQATLQMPVVAN